MYVCFTYFRFCIFADEVFSLFFVPDRKKVRPKEISPCCRSGDFRNVFRTFFRFLDLFDVLGVMQLGETNIVSRFAFAVREEFEIYISEYNIILIFKKRQPNFMASSNFALINLMVFFAFLYVLK